MSEAAFFDYATVKNSQHNSEVKLLVGAGPRAETFARAAHRKGATIEECCKHVSETSLSTVVKRSVCVKFCTAQVEDWACQMRVPAPRQRLHVIVEDARQRA